MKDQISYPDFAKLDLRVGTITQVEKVPETEKLYRIKVDLGEEVGVRQIVSGIAQEYQPEELLKRQIIVLVNLEPRKIKGEESQGMLLAAVVGTTQEAVILGVAKPVANGTPVS